MNIWAWVRETNARLRRGEPNAQRLAQLIDELPSAAVNEAHERVESMVPEALALARELDEPWVQLFVRHWNLQSRVLHRRRAGDELREAVSLLDFASGAQTQACPQSVCAVQDLAVCYAIRDGPGYVPQRLAVAQETLARIDPSWGCFDCISAEYVSALLDDDKPADALAFIERQAKLAAEHGELEPGFNSRLNRARALALLDRAEQALEIVDGIRDPAHYGRSRQMAHRQCRVGILLRLERVDEALALHPPLSTIIDTGGHLRDWVDNLAALIDLGALDNTAQVGRDLLKIQRQFFESSAYWDTARTALIGARLAAARGARVVTRLLLDDVDAVIGELRRPQLLASKREAVEASLAALERTPVSIEPSRDPERELDRLAHQDPDLGQDQDPQQDQVDRLLERAAALREVGRADMARTLLEASSAAHEGVRLELAQTLLAAHDHAALELLVGNEDASSLALRWVLGQSLRERGLLERAIALDQATLDRAPQAHAFRLRLAAVARAHADWETALDALELAAASVPPGTLDWDRITAATVLGRWASVRAAAARLGLELPDGELDDLANERPMDARLGVIRCEFIEASGERQRCWARRTSPCGAQIIEISMPADPQHFHDRVVFEPVDLDAHLREPAEPTRHRPCFEVVAITEPGAMRAFLLRGHDPGTEAFEQLRAQIHAQGFGFERITNPGRTAVDPRVEADTPDPPQLPTVGVLVAIPTAADPAALRDLLHRATASWPLPLLCPALDQAVGADEASEQAVAMLKRWHP
ncbi:TPR repeat protein [Enhygromyxa salina]|uniref:TPR repeat protein n=1 Tax=Enhygromyxa salina TaxID=215803 RepID=A0A0C2D550_9BACT|nr:hypothetical protein [Enhygromyxa salina]KIG15177.1 TPR repeat protein [Enhygromyxa salina]